MNDKNNKKPEPIIQVVTCDHSSATLVIEFGDECNEIDVTFEVDGQWQPAILSASITVLGKKIEFDIPSEHESDIVGALEEAYQAHVEDQAGP